jgi:hypothetical protein
VRLVFFVYRSNPVIIASVICFITQDNLIDRLWKAESLIRVSLTETWKYNGGTLRTSSDRLMNNKRKSGSGTTRPQEDREAPQNSKPH